MFPLTFCPKSKGNINESVCKKCSEYETQLKEVLDELGLAQTVIKILQKELPTSTTIKNAYGNDLVSKEGFGKQVNTRVWTLVTSKNYTVKPNKSDKCETATSDQLITTTNRFTPLSNPEINNADSSGLQEQSELSTQNMHKTMKQHRIGIKIPMIVNGRIMNSDDRNPTTAKKNVTYVSGTNFNNKEHKVKIVGDSHHRGTATRIDQYLNTKF
jgi:hypothetical protein